MQELILISEKEYVFHFNTIDNYYYPYESIKVPETIEELKEYYKNNNRIKVDDKTVKDNCFIWVYDNLGNPKLFFTIRDSKISCVTLDTQIKSLADLCLTINKILGGYNAPKM